MIQKDGLFWSLFSAFFGMFDSPKQRGYPLWEGTENSSQLEAIKLTISDYPEYPLFMCSNSTLFGRPWCNKKPPWIHDSGRVKNHHNWIRNLLDYVGMRPTSGLRQLSRLLPGESHKVPVCADLCKLPVHFVPSKMSIISTPQGLETIKDLCIIKETKKVFEIRLQKLHFGEFQEIQLFGVQNRWNLDTSSPGKPEGNVYRQGHS